MPNTNDLYRRGLSPDNETERNNAILKALLYTRVLVPVEADYEAASKKAHDFNHKAERYRLEHPIQANSPYDRLLMDMTVLREVIAAALGIGETP